MARQMQYVVNRSNGCAIATIHSPEICRKAVNALVLTHTGRHLFPVWRRPVMLAMLMGMRDNGSSLSRLRDTPIDIVQKIWQNVSASTSVENQLQEALRIIIRHFPLPIQRFEAPTFVQQDASSNYLEGVI